jgi:hypothetical protein
VEGERCGGRGPGRTLERDSTTTGRPPGLEKRPSYGTVTCRATRPRRMEPRPRRRGSCRRSLDTSLSRAHSTLELAGTARLARIAGRPESGRSWQAARGQPSCLARTRLPRRMHGLGRGRGRLRPAMRLPHGHPLPGALVQAAEDSLPDRLVRTHHLPVLADGSAGLRRPGNPVTNGLPTFGSGRSSSGIMRPPYRAPIELERSAMVIDPGLVPPPGIPGARHHRSGRSCSRLHR